MVCDDYDNMNIPCSCGYVLLLVQIDTVSVDIFVADCRRNKDDAITFC